MTGNMTQKITMRSNAIYSKLNGFALMIALTASTCALAQPAAQSARVDMGDFKIDLTEVSIGRFAEYAKRKNVVTEAERSGGGFEYVMGWQKRKGWNWRTPFGTPAQPDEPAVQVKWSEARAFCQDAGGDLPTKAQWQRAAYTEQRQNPPAPFVRGKTYEYPTGETGEGANVKGGADGWETHAPVGRTRAGVNGLFDMGANAWEWLLDSQGKTHLTAGGSWWYGPSQMRVEGMQYKPEDVYVVYIGFRCVY